MKRGPKTKATEEELDSWFSAAEPSTEPLADEVRAIAAERHALNVLIAEGDWRGASEIARLDARESVSDVVRSALRRYIEQHPLEPGIRKMVEESLEFEHRTRERRRDVMAARTGP